MSLWPTERYIDKKTIKSRTKKDKTTMCDPESPKPRRHHKRRAYLTQEDLNNMVSRLSITNTTTAMKATLDSQPRFEFEYYFRASASFKTLEDCRVLYEDIPTVTSRECTTPDDVGRIVARVSTPTTSQRRRAEASMNRRKVIEDHKAKMWLCDVASKLPKH